MRRVLFLLFCATIGLAACKRSADGERSRYQQARDRIEAVATKNPTMKGDIQAKLADFDKAFKAADAKSGDDQIAALAALNDRVSGYEKAIAPAPAAVPDAPAAAKLGSKLGAAPASAPATQPAGKLGAAPAPASAPATQPAGKLGAAPASQPASAPPPKSGFGGAPDAPAARSGFGGK